MLEVRGIGSLKVTAAVKAFILLTKSHLLCDEPESLYMLSGIPIKLPEAKQYASQQGTPYLVR